MADQPRFCPRCAAALGPRSVHGRVRPCCPSCSFVHFPDPKVGVGALVVDAGEVLLVRRGAAPMPGAWSLPGGFLDDGEEPRRAVEREAAEEAGLRIRAGGLLDVVCGTGEAWLFLLYAARLIGPREPRGGDDATDARFFAPGALPELAFPSTRAALHTWFHAPG